MQLYIDESGNLGTAGRFFVITSLSPSKANPKRIKKVMRRACVRFGQPNVPLEEIKGFNLSFVKKQELLNLLCSKDDFNFSYIVADKKYLEPKIIVDQNICYNYLANHLLKRIIKGASEDIQVILDNHSIKVKSLYSLADYIRIQAYTSWEYKGNISFEYKDSKSHYALQAVDIISNVVYGRYEHKKTHLFDMLSTFLKYPLEFPYQKFNT